MRPASRRLTRRSLRASSTVGTSKLRSHTRDHHPRLWTCVIKPLRDSAAMPGHDAGVRVINPAAHSAAQQKDAELRQILARGGQLPPLFCVPVLVKVGLDRDTCHPRLDTLSRVVSPEANTVCICTDAEIGLHTASANATCLRRRLPVECAMRCRTTMTSWAWQALQGQCRSLTTSQRQTPLRSAITHGCCERLAGAASAAGCCFCSRELSVRSGVEPPKRWCGHAGEDEHGRVCHKPARIQGEPGCRAGRVSADEFCGVLDVTVCNVHTTAGTHRRCCPQGSLFGVVRNPYDTSARTCAGASSHVTPACRVACGVL